MINTYNESQIHKVLKDLYAQQNPNSKTEAKSGNFIADILCPDGTVIEIQTGNLHPLKNKIETILSENRKIIIVHPFITQKTIRTSDLNNKITNKKSPKKENIYSAFKSLTGIVNYIGNKNLEIHLIELHTIEYRAKTQIPVQNNCNSRHFKKDWIKTGCEIEEIGSTWVFNSRKSWLSLIPDELQNKNWTVKDLFSIQKDKIKYLKENDIRLYLWVLYHGNLIKIKGKKGKTNIYEI